MNEQTFPETHPGRLLSELLTLFLLPVIHSLRLTAHRCDVGGSGETTLVVVFGVVKTTIAVRLRLVLCCHCHVATAATDRTTGCRVF